MIETYWSEFLIVATAHLFAVMSPGPDFAIVLKHSISYGRKVAIYTSVGIAIGLFIHIAYSLLGIGLLIKTTPWLFNALIYCAAAYLAYIGWGALKSSPNTKESNVDDKAVKQTMGSSKALWVGVLTNGLNPKATLFFLSLFALAVSPQTPTQVKMMYGVYMVVATGIWFSLLSSLLSSSKVRRFFTRNGFWFDRVMGIVLIALALKIAIETIL